MKRLLYILGIVLGCSLLVVGMLVAVASSSKVQTAAVKVIAQELSKGLHAKVSVGNVDSDFLNRLTVDSIYLEDQHGDSLAYIGNLQAKYNLLGLLKKRIIFKEVALDHVYINAYETDSVMNYQYLLDAFGNKKDTSTFDGLIRVDELRLSDAKIRYNDWYVDSLSACVALKNYSKNALDAEVVSLYARERSGVEIDEFAAHVIADSAQVAMPQLVLKMPNTELSVSNVVISKDSVSGQIDNGVVTLSDVSSVVPALKGMRKPIELTGYLSGNTDSICAQNLSVAFNGSRILKGDVTIIDSTTISAKLEDLYVNKAILQDIVSCIQDKPYQTPEIIDRLGNIHYRGTLNGTMDSIAMKGQLSTRLGNVSTDGTLRTDSTRAVFNGALSTRHLNVGGLTGVKDLGYASLRLNGKVAANLQTSEVNATMKGVVNSLEYKGYTYKDAKVDGKFVNNRFEGQLHTDDEHIGLNFDGIIDFSKQMPEYNFALDVHRLHLDKLNLVTKYPDSDLRFGAHINLTGSNLDNLEGELSIDTLTYIAADANHPLKMEKLRGTIAPNEAFIWSDYLNVEVTGDFDYSTLGTSLMRMAALYLPRAFDADKLDELLAQKNNNQLQATLHIKRPNDIFRALGMDMEITGNPVVQAVFNEPEVTFQLYTEVDRFRKGKSKYKDLSLDINNRNGQLNFVADAIKRQGANVASEKIGDLSLRVMGSAREDSLYLDLGWLNHTDFRNMGILKTQTHFGQYAGKPLIDVNIVPTEMILNDSTWYAGNCHLIYNAADTLLEVRNFRFANRTQSIYANGMASARPTDSLVVYLNDINLDYLLDYTAVEKAVNFTGEISGWAVIYGLLSQPLFSADVEMVNAEINHAPVGDAYASARFNREERTISIVGNVIDNMDTVGHVDGLVTPAQREWDLQITADSISLAFINFWTSGILDNVSGRGYGDVHVWGKKYDDNNKKVWVTVNALGQDAEVGIGVIGTRYHFTDSVILDTNAIYFNHIDAYDKEGNPVKLNGIIRHESFHNWDYHLHIDAEHALCMDLPDNPQDMFHGRVYATGTVDIDGNDDLCNISVDAQTNRKTDFTLSIATANNAHDNSFITFVDHTIVRDTTDIVTRQVQKRGTKMLLSLQIAVTPEAQISLLMDNKSGDKLRGRGNGDITIDYDNSSGDVRMYGTYTLQEGLFNFTLQNVIRKDFQLQNGSQIIWSGVAENPTINATAIYSTTASLRDLFGSDYANVGTNRTSVPVNCILYLRDQLNNPSISFGIELPQADESVASQVKSIINTDEMLMRQIIYLLVFNRFYTPDYLSTSTAPGLNETYSLLSSTVTGQINSWISKLTTDFSVGLNVRTDGEGSNSSQEYEAQFQYQHNNRLLINGNFGYRYNDISNQPVFGNLDVEYLLSPSGNWRAKAYTHTVDKYSIREAHTIQGVGFKFQKDFNFSDIKPNMEARKKARAERKATKEAEKAAEQLAERKANRDAVNNTKKK